MDSKPLTDLITALGGGLKCYNVLLHVHISWKTHSDHRNVNMLEWRGSEASYNQAIVLGQFSGETSLPWGQQPQSPSLPMLSSPPERHAQDHLRKALNELDSYL